MKMYIFYTLYYVNEQAMGAYSKGLGLKLMSEMWGKHDRHIDKVMNLMLVICLLMMV